MVLLAQQTLLLTPSLVLLLAWKGGSPCHSFPFPRTLLKRASTTISPAVVVQRMMTTADETPTTTVQLSAWMPLNPESLVSAPCLIEQTLCQPKNGVDGEDEPPQLAKDLDYATAVLDAWKAEEEDAASEASMWDAEWCHCRYYASDHNDDEGGDGTPLYGHLIRKTTTTAVTSKPEPLSPGVVFFHTGAGPHDLFLLYKASNLVNTLHVNNQNDNDASSSSSSSSSIVVLIADILSDATGWAWSPDRTRYNQVREQVLGGSKGNNHRPRLRARVQAALSALQNCPGVDPKRFAALGWCLGGHPILETAKLQNPNIRALGTFHGVFDGVVGAPSSNKEDENDDTRDNTDVEPPPEVLICHGTQDPFVSHASLEQALALLQDLGCTRTSLLQLNARHGFTNPAQDFNDNPAFAFDADAAETSWRQMCNLLGRALHTKA